jgi:hypothetical protein
LAFLLGQIIGSYAALFILGQFKSYPKEKIQVILQVFQILVDLFDL